MARQYKRDARGRFASGGSSGRRAGGTLAARASLRKSRQKLAAKDAADTSLKGTLSKRAQKAAVTKGSKKLREVKKASTVRLTKRGGTIGRPRGYVRPGERVTRSLASVKRGRGAAGSAATKTYSKVDRSVDAIRRRRARAMAERSSISPSSGFSMARTFRSMITRSAANAIYNRQRATTKALSKDGKVADEVLRSGIGVVPGLSGNKRNRADQLRESARKRVIAGRRGRR